MILKDKKGSISIFVLVMLLFMSAFLIISFAGNVNKSKAIKEQFNIISGIYAYGGGDEGAYDKAYTDLRQKNTRIFSFENEQDADKTIFENTGTVELTKTIAGNISDYRIYGKSINLFDINSVTKFYLSNGNEMTDGRATISDGVITSNKGVYSQGVYCESNITILPAGTYTLSAYVMADKTEGNKRIRIGIRTKAGKEYGNYFNITDYQTWERFTYQFTLTSESEILGLQLQGAGEAGDYSELNIKFKNIQLEEGDIATPYVPYGIGVGDQLNILDKSQSDSAGIRNETSLSHWVANAFLNNWVINNLKPDTTYTISYDVECTNVPEYDSKFSGNLGFYLMGRTNVSLLHSGFLNKGEKVHVVKTFTTPSDLLDPTAKYGIVMYTNRYIKDGAGVLGEMIFRNIQIEERDFETGYIPYGKYGIPIRLTNESGESVIKTICLDTPLLNNEYIDFKQRKVIRNDGTEEVLNLPELPVYEDYTKIEVLTDVAPSKMETEYIGYTLD